MGDKSHRGFILVFVISSNKTKYNPFITKKHFCIKVKSLLKKIQTKPQEKSIYCLHEVIYDSDCQ